MKITITNLILSGSIFFFISCDAVRTSYNDTNDHQTPGHSISLSGTNLTGSVDDLLLDEYVNNSLNLIGGTDYGHLLDKIIQEGRLRVIIRLDVPFTPEGLLTDLEAQQQRNTIHEAQETLLTGMVLLNISAEKRFIYTPFLAMEVDEEALLFLTESSLVKDLMEDLPEEPALHESTPLIGANAAWSAGYTGNGYTIVILDTGVDTSHPFFGSRILGEQACFSTNDPGRNVESLCPNGQEEDFSYGSGNHCDLSISNCSHGTRVAGIAAGSGSSFSGVAKQADIITVQVYSKFNNESDCGFSPAPCTRSYISDQMKALEWVYSLRRSHDISSVNLSTAGNPQSSSCGKDSRKPGVDNLRSTYIATIAPSGNHGSSNGISAPACISSAISVGSTTKSDRHSSFSNNAGHLKLLAPGSSIRSAVPGGGFSTASGTSLAAPHVAGAWAVVRQAHPAANVSEVLQMLEETGVPIQNNNNGNSKPRIQVDAAVSDPSEYQVIYDDELVSPWINASWSASVDFNNGQHAFTGNRSIRVDQEAWGALSVRNETWNSTVGIKYKSLSFAIYPEEPVNIDVKLENDEGAHFQRFRYGEVEPGKWTTIHASLTDMNPDQNTVHRISIAESSGAPKTFYVDAWRLANEEIPPGEPDPEPEDPQTLAVYTDGLNSPWINASWSASIDFNHSGQSHSGSRSIRVDQNAWGGLSAHHGSWNAPADIQPGEYEWLEFAIYAPNETLTIDLQLSNSDGSSFPRMRQSTVDPGSWQVISVPVSELNPNEQVIHRVTIMETSGLSKTYFVDDWRFSSGEEQMAAN